MTLFAEHDPRDEPDPWGVKVPLDQLPVLEALIEFASDSNARGVTQAPTEEVFYMPHGLEAFEYVCHEYGHAYFEGIPHDPDLTYAILRGTQDPDEVRYESEAAAFVFTLEVFRRLNIGFALAIGAIVDAADVQGVCPGRLQECFDSGMVHEWVDDYITRYKLKGLPPQEQSDEQLPQTI